MYWKPGAYFLLCKSLVKLEVQERTLECQIEKMHQIWLFRVIPNLLYNTVLAVLTIYSLTGYTVRAAGVHSAVHRQGRRGTLSGTLRVQIPTKLHSLSMWFVPDRERRVSSFRFRKSGHWVVFKNKGLLIWRAWPEHEYCVLVCKWPHKSRMSMFYSCVCVTLEY